MKDSLAESTNLAAAGAELPQGSAAADAFGGGCGADTREASMEMECAAGTKSFDLNETMRFRCLFFFFKNAATADSQKFEG